MGGVVVTVGQERRTSTLGVELDREQVPDLNSLRLDEQRAVKERQANNVAPVPTSVTQTQAELFATQPDKLREFMASLPEARRPEEVRRLLYTALVTVPDGRAVAAKILDNLDGLGSDTSGYRQSLAVYEQGLADNQNARSTLPDPSLRGPRRSFSPEVRTLGEQDRSRMAVVPQNTAAIIPSGSAATLAVTTEVYDCVVLTYWDPTTKTGGLAHIPAGSNGDLTALREELKQRGLAPDRMQFTIMGGVDYSSTGARDTGELIPSAIPRIQSLEQQLARMGVSPSAIGYSTIHSRDEVTNGRSNIGLDLTTGRAFYFTDPQRVVPSAVSRGWQELQDSVTDVYTL